MLVGLVELFEARLGVLVAGIAIRVALHRRLAERGLQVSVRGGLGDAQDLVKVALGHFSSQARLRGGSHILDPFVARRRLFWPCQPFAQARRDEKAAPSNVSAGEAIHAFV